MRIKKESLLPGLKLPSASTAHGGELSKGKRKTFRPLDPKQALHVVLRSTRATGTQSMLHPRNRQPIQDFTQKIAQKLGVKIYQFSNVGNHLHLLIKFSSRAIWKRFLRELAGGIAMIVTGAKKGIACPKNESQRGFWDFLAFTRIVKFGRDFENLCEYLLKNLAEAAGVPMKKLLAKKLSLSSHRLATNRNHPPPLSRILTR
jgi:REP element-mobilizing transposase RayT